MKNILTQGTQDVTRIVAYRNRTAYYEASSSERPGERHVYSVPDVNSAKARIPFCLTCDLSITTNCSFFEAKLSPKADMFAFRCLGPVAPFTEIRRTPSNALGSSYCIPYPVLLPLTRLAQSSVASTSLQQPSCCVREPFLSCGP